MLAMMLASALTGVYAASYTPGATVVANSSSPSGYSVHFVYDGGGASNIAKVQVTGPFNYLSVTSDLKESMANGSTKVYTPDEYVNGMYATNLYPDATGAIKAGYTKDMTLDSTTGYYETSFPITSGSFAYSYIVTYLDGTSKTIMDPANKTRFNGNSDIDTGDLTHSTVYGAYDAKKQSKSLDLSYVNEATKNQGEVTYVEYKGSLSNHQDLGIYLPASYNSKRAEGYKVIYASHGGGGNETDWFAMGKANNIMDNLINADSSKEAIVVTMDNASYKWDFAKIEDNVLNYIIPYMEKHYNVSTAVQDRAFCGLSMGGMTTTHMYFDHPEAFGYFGVFSGSDNTAFKTASDALKKPYVMTMAGTADIASKTIMEAPVGKKIEDLVSYFKTNSMTNYVDYGLVPGSHDWFTWAQAFHAFAGSVAFSNNSTASTTTPTAPTTTKVTAPGKTVIKSLKSQSKKKLTVTYKKVTEATGYQIAYKKTTSKTWKTTTTSRLTKTISKLSRKKKYAVKVRSYKTVSGKKYYSAYTSSKTIKIK